MECKWSTKKENNFVLHLYLSFHLHSPFNRNRERTIQYKSPSLNVARLVVPKISKKSRINITRFLSLPLFFFSLPTNHGIHRAILFGFLPLRSSATSSSVGWYGKHVTEPYCLAVARNRVVKIRKKNNNMHAMIIMTVYLVTPWCTRLGHLSFIYHFWRRSQRGGKSVLSSRVYEVSL